jgi:hypothetical protein
MLCHAREAGGGGEHGPSAAAGVSVSRGEQVEVESMVRVLQLVYELGEEHRWSSVRAKYQALHTLC